MVSDDLTERDTSHARLVRQPYQWAQAAKYQICTVVFNYDLLVEDTCRDDFRLNPVDFDAYLVPASTPSPSSPNCSPSPLDRLAPLSGIGPQSSITTRCTQIMTTLTELT
jgi:hypothetical protein